MARRIIQATAIVMFVMMAFGCANRARTGAATGAVLGGLLGEAIDDDGEEGLIIGAIAGGALGYIIGNEMDKRDKRQMQKGLETKKNDQTHKWTNQKDGTRYSVTPVRTFKNDKGQPCREFILRMKKDGETERSKGVSCQKENGEWEMIKQTS